MAWWWPFGRKKEPLEQWLDSYDLWLKDFERLMRKFPDHTVLEGVRLSGGEEHLLENISELYGLEVRQALEMMVLRAVQLRKKQLSANSSR